MKKNLKLFTEGNCLDIVSRITKTMVLVIIIGMVIIFKSYFVANAEQMEMFQSLNGGFDSFTMTDFEGNEYTEDMFKGHKVTMINIWATTCHGCIMEIQMGVLKSVIAYPTTIFLDENGNQLKVMEGSRSKSMWIDTIEEVIESEK